MLPASCDAPRSNDREAAASYNARNSMAKLLEELEPGTPVYLADRRVGTVRAVYAEGAARLAEYLRMEWTERNTDILVPTKDVLSIEDRGIVLMGDDERAYADIPDFDEASYPTIRKIA